MFSLRLRRVKCLKTKRIILDWYPPMPMPSLISKQFRASDLCKSRTHGATNDGEAPLVIWIRPLGPMIWKTRSTMIPTSQSKMMMASFGSTLNPCVRILHPSTWIGIQSHSHTAMYCIRKWIHHAHTSPYEEGCLFYFRLWHGHIGPKKDVYNLGKWACLFLHSLLTWNHRLQSSIQFANHRPW